MSGRMRRGAAARPDNRVLDLEDPVTHAVNQVSNGAILSDWLTVTRVQRP